MYLHLVIRDNIVLRMTKITIGNFCRIDGLGMVKGVLVSGKCGLTSGLYLPIVVQE